MNCSSRCTGAKPGKIKSQARNFDFEPKCPYHSQLTTQFGLTFHPQLLRVMNFDANSDLLSAYCGLRPLKYCPTDRHVDSITFGFVRIEDLPASRDGVLVGPLASSAHD